MAFYIDSLLRWNSEKQKTCHLTTDDHSPDGIKALVAFAYRIGLSAHTIQRQKTQLDHWLYPYLLLSPRFRRIAQRYGAIEVTVAELAWLCARQGMRPKLSLAPDIPVDPTDPTVDDDKVASMQARLQAAREALRGGTL